MLVSRKLVAAGILLSGILGPLVACAAHTDQNRPVIDPAVRAATATGPTRAHVELRLPGGWRPEGDLGGQAVAHQRAAIASTRAVLLARLAGTAFRLLREHESVPLVSLEIGADALAALELMGDIVARVHEDAAMLPQAAPTPGGSPR
jgi:hypothetical protein